MAQQNSTNNAVVLLRNMSHAGSGEGKVSWSQDSRGHLDKAKRGEAAVCKIERKVLWTLSPLTRCYLLITSLGPIWVMNGCQTCLPRSEPKGAGKISFCQSTSTKRPNRAVSDTLLHQLHEHQCRATLENTSISTLRIKRPSKHGCRTTTKNYEKRKD